MLLFFYSVLVLSLSSETKCLPSSISGEGEDAQTVSLESLLFQRREGGEVLKDRGFQGFQRLVPQSVLMLSLL